jgi:hypothetical protein
MGGPQDPTPQQLAELEEASELVCLREEEILASGGVLRLTCELPRQGVGLFRVEG